MHQNYHTKNSPHVFSIHISMHLDTNATSSTSSDAHWRHINSLINMKYNWFIRLDFLWPDWSVQVYIMSNILVSYCCKTHGPSLWIGDVLWIRHTTDKSVVKLYFRTIFFGSVTVIDSFRVLKILHVTTGLFHQHICALDLPVIKGIRILPFVHAWLPWDKYSIWYLNCS